MTEEAAENLPAYDAPFLTLSDLCNEPYEHRGIPHSELLLFIELCAKFEIDTIIESGRARGQSTFILSKYLYGENFDHGKVHVHSVERLYETSLDENFAKSRMHQLMAWLCNRGGTREQNWDLWNGDANSVLPVLIQQARGRIAILCDGPKGAAAVDLITKCFALSPNVILGAVHDMRKLDHDKPSPHRAYLAEKYPNTLFSDDPACLALVPDPEWIDANVLKAGGPVGPAHIKKFGSYGPTLGIFRADGQPVL